VKVIVINGSSRKKWNTAMLLEKALEGAVSQGAEADLFTSTIWISRDVRAAFPAN